MIKRHRKSSGPLMRHASRVFLNDLNVGKTVVIKDFLVKCHDVTQYFVDLFWQRRDFSANLADLPTVHLGCERFEITTRLSQAMAKQARECIRAACERDGRKARRPNVHKLTSTLYSHFVEVSPFEGSFDFAVKLIGSGAPRLVIPCRSTKHLNRLIGRGFAIGKSIRLGVKKGRVFIDFMLEKARPPRKSTGRVVGMDSNYKNGFVFSDGQNVGQSLVEKICSFSVRGKHTHKQITDMVGAELKKVDWSGIKMLVIEDLKSVKSGRRGKFRRLMNRRLSHWLYAYVADWIGRCCEDAPGAGTRVEKKNPAYTSQYCCRCNKWDRRNRRGDKFVCVNCGHSDHADSNASKNLELLGLAGVYGLRLLQSQASDLFDS